MPRTRTIFILVLFLWAATATVQAQAGKKIDLLYADETEFVFSKEKEIRWVNGAVIFQTTSGMVYCDSAMWEVGEMVIMRGNVIVDDADYRLVADSVHYDIVTGRAHALGGYVELWSRADSLFAIGSQAFFDRERDYFYMMERPTVFLNYPDSGRMIEVIADYVQYDRPRELAEAEGSVVISSDEFTSTSGCAVMYPRRNTLDLFESPILRRKQSEISGRFISVASEGGQIRRVDVIDSARGEFVEQPDTLENRFDRSILAGNRILMDFIAGDLRTVTCYGQAYSWYFPAPVDGGEQIENEVSGDTIRFNIANEELRQVDVIGGAVGSYLSSTVKWQANEPDSTQDSTQDSVSFDSATLLAVDSSSITITDTINYNADFIAYSLFDSLISLQSKAKTSARDVALEAYRIQLDTKERIIEAFSGSVEGDSVTSANIFEKELQPNEVPVVLRDRTQNLTGDYMRYSLETEKGRIIKSKSDYETGFFYGEKLHRQHKNIYYLENGRYTTCDADEPHFHFKSSNLKLIEGNKLIAKPVVLHIGRLPILALPFYVFPLEKGRHSGLLPFTLGNIEKGERYIRNVGYYWAASEYWDWQGAMDYFEDRDRLNLFSRVMYRKRYAFDGSIQGNYGTERGFDNVNIVEFRKKRWTLKVSHNQEFSPSFRVSASGDIRSDPTYYNDFSTDLEERLNRIVRSQINFSKKFGNNVSISGSIKHDDYLDTESRTDLLPTLNVSLPALRPFGSGSLDEDGRLQRHWYNELIVTYRPSLINYSNRVTKEAYGDLLVDTLNIDTSIVVVDSLTMETDTTISYDIVESQDTTSYRSRKEYTRVDHSVSARFPLKVARYFVFNPSFSYAENWYKIRPTDQSENNGIDASTTYRRYRYSMGGSFSTELYGTVYPHLFGLIGLRQVVQPTVSYAYTPEFNRHPAIASYAGGVGASSRVSQSLRFALNHVYQAKLRQGEADRNVELLSVSHSFSYDFEATGRKFSNLSTTLRSSLLKNIRFDASMTHNMYRTLDQDDTELNIWGMQLTSFRINGTLSLRGQNFLFDDARTRIPMGADSLSQLARKTQPTGRKGWDLSATYSYSERGKWTDFFDKSSFLRMTLHFNLTPATQITYSQYYDFVDKKTVASQVNIVKTIHCWTGTFHWVPTGSTRGWGFELKVTALPAVKIDNSQNSLSSGYLQGQR